MINNQQEYQTALRYHDWDFHCSDCSMTYLRGREERKELEIAQPKLDADFSIWNSVAPANYRRPRVLDERDDEFQTKSFAVA
jgi:hypothetical protein